MKKLPKGNPSNLQTQLFNTILITFLTLSSSSCAWILESFEEDDDCPGLTITTEMTIAYEDNTLIGEESMASTKLSSEGTGLDCLDLDYEEAYWNDELISLSGQTELDSMGFVEGSLIIETNVGTYSTDINLSPIYVPADLTLDKDDDFRIIWEGEPLRQNERVTIRICSIACVEEKLEWNINNDGISWFIIPQNELRWLLPGDGRIEIKRTKEYIEEEVGHFTMRKDIKTKYTSVGSVRIKF